MSIKLQLPKLVDVKPRITVIGVGGAGCNAVNNMIAAGIARRRIRCREHGCAVA